MRAPSIRIECEVCGEAEVVSSEEHGRDIAQFFAEYPDRATLLLDRLLRDGVSEGIDPSTGHPVRASIVR